MSLLARFYTVCALFCLSACGFHTVYGERAGQTGKLMSGVQIETAHDRLSHKFKQHLEDQLNPPGGEPPSPAYNLNVTLTSTENPIGIARDGTVSRYNVILNSMYQLTRIKDQKLISQGNVQHVSSYNNLTNAYFSTYISQRDAEERGVVELSEQFRQRIATIIERGDIEPEKAEPENRK